MAVVGGVAVILAHSGHWYHSALYLLPVLLIALGLWWSGRRDDRAGAAEADGERSGERGDPAADDLET